MLVLNDLVRKCESIVAMVERGANRGIDVVARSCFEGYVDLLNLSQFGEEYTFYMQWRSNRQQLSAMQPFVGKHSRTAATYRRQSEHYLGKSLADVVDEIREENASLARKISNRFRDKTGKIQKRDRLRFELAKHDEEYDLYYRSFSFAVHGDLAGMLEGVTDRGALIWPPLEPVKQPIGALDAVCRMLLASTRRLAKRYKKPVAPLNSLLRELGEDGSTKIL